MEISPLYADISGVRGAGGELFQRPMPIGMAQLLQRFEFDLADAFAGQVKFPTDFFEGMRPAFPNAEVQA